MKLYTEEQIIKAYNMGIDDGHNGAISLQINELSLTPIELPSEEEIESNMIEQDIVRKEGYCHCFLEGAKWMKQQILNQNK